MISRQGGSFFRTWSVNSKKCTRFHFMFFLRKTIFIGSIKVSWANYENLCEKIANPARLQK